MAKESRRTAQGVLKTHFLPSTLKLIQFLLSVTWELSKKAFLMAKESRRIRTQLAKGKGTSQSLEIVMYL